MNKTIFLIISIIGLTACSNDDNQSAKAKKIPFKMPESSPFKPLMNDLEKAKKVEGILNDRAKDLDKLLK